MHTLWLSLLAFAMSVSAAHAVVVQIDFSVSTTGVPNPAVGTVVIDNPFDDDVLNSLIGLTPSGFNFDVDGFVVFTYVEASDVLTLGGSVSGGAGAISINTNDFLIRIDDFLTAPVVVSALVVQTGQGFIAVHDDPISDELASVTVTIPNATVPLPAPVWLLLTGVAALGFVRRRRCPHARHRYRVAGAV